MNIDQILNESSRQDRNVAATSRPARNAQPSTTPKTAEDAKTVPRDAAEQLILEAVDKKDYFKTKTADPSPEPSLAQPITRRSASADDYMYASASQQHAAYIQRSPRLHYSSQLHPSQFFQSQYGPPQYLAQPNFLPQQSQSQSQPHPHPHPLPPPPPQTWPEQPQQHWQQHVGQVNNVVPSPVYGGYDGWPRQYVEQRPQWPATAPVPPPPHPLPPSVDTTQGLAYQGMARYAYEGAQMSTPEGGEGDMPDDSRSIASGSGARQKRRKAPNSTWTTEEDRQLVGFLDFV